MTGCGVPLHRAANARIDVGFTCGNEAEFQRRTGALGVGNIVFVDVVIGRLIAVRFRGNDQQSVIVWRADADRFGFADGFFIERTHFLDRVATGVGVEQALFGGRIHDAAHRRAVHDVGDVHGEIAATLYEFLGAVERIDDEESADVLVVAVSLFFSHQRNIRKLSAQTGGDQGIGRFVGLGHGAFVALRFHLEIGAVVDLHDLVTGFESKAAHHRRKFN